MLSLHLAEASSYRLRRSVHGHHLCTAEVAAACLALAGEGRAAEVLGAWLDVFSAHYLSARRSIPLDRDIPSYQLLKDLPSSG